MQIGSAMNHAAPLTLPLATGSSSSGLSRPQSGSDALAPGQAPGPSEQLSPREAADSPERDSRQARLSSAEARQQLLDRQEITELASRDREVRSHEQAHAAVGGAYAGAPSYSFKRGPDGQSYATGGEVGIDTSPIPNDPEATLRKMERVQRAALAPAEPSAQDRRVAAQAAVQAAQARIELAQLQREEARADEAQRAQRREERQAAEQSQGVEESEGLDKNTPQALVSPPGLDLYLRLAQLQAPVSARVDLRV